MRTCRMFARHWRGLLVCSLPGYLAALPLLLTLGTAGGAGPLDLIAGYGQPGGLLRLGLSAVAVLALAVAAGALAAGTMIAGVAAALSGSRVRPVPCLRAAVRCWARVIAVQLPGHAVLVAGGMAVPAAAALIPVQPLAALFALAAGWMLVPAFGFQAPYLVVAGGLGPRAAWQTVWHGLRVRPAEHLWAGLCLSGLAAGLGLAGWVLGQVPLFGGWLSLLFQVALAPLGPLYLALRYERRVRVLAALPLAVRSNGRICPD